MARNLTPEDHLKKLQDDLMPQEWKILWEAKNTNIDEIMKDYFDKESSKLRNKSPESDLIEADFYAKEILDKSISQHGAIKSFEFILKDLFDKIKTILDTDEKTKLDNCAIGLLPMDDFETCAIHIKDCGSLIAFDMILIPTIFQMNQTLFSTFGVQLGESLSSRQVLNPKEGANRLYEIARYYILHPPRSQPFHLGETPFEANYISTNFSIIQETFLIAHEIGHILAGHFDDCNIRSIAFFGECIDAAAVMRKKKEELEADRLAFDITKRFIESSMPSLSEYVFDATGIIFLYFNLFEELDFIPRFTHSHPTAQERLENIRKSFKRDPKEGDRLLFSQAQRLCKSVHHPIIEICPIQDINNTKGLDYFRPDEGFYFPGEIINNKHSISLLSLLLKRVHIYDLDTKKILDDDWVRWEPRWRQVAESVAEGSELWFEHVRVNLKKHGYQLSRQEIKEANIESLVEYSWQWNPFYKYAESLIHCNPPILLPVKFDGDDPSKMGELSIEEIVPVLSKEDLKYNWQLNRNAGIQYIMRRGSRDVSALIVSDTPMKFRREWLPGIPNRDQGKPMSLVIAEWDLPTIPILSPSEVIEVRLIIQRILEDFWKSLEELYRDINEIDLNILGEDLIDVLKQISIRFEKTTRNIMTKIELEICSRYPNRDRRHLVGRLIIGPIASSRVLAPIKDSELITIDSINKLDPIWFRKLFKLCGLAMVLTGEGIEDWPLKRDQNQKIKLESKRETDNEDYCEIIDTAIDHANKLYHQNRLEDARIIYEKVLLMNEHLYGKESIKTAISMDNLSRVMYDQGDINDAENTLKKAFQIYSKYLGKDHQFTRDAFRGLILIKIRRFIGLDVINIFNKIKS